MNTWTTYTTLESKSQENNSKLCDGPLTIKECIEAVEKRKLNKSPGLDRITAEFIQRSGTI